MGYYYIFLMIFLSMFFVIEALFEKYKPRFGHTSAVIVCLGILLSWAIWSISKSSEVNGNNDEFAKVGDELKEALEFSPVFFFSFILPLIVFPSGFNMRRKKFFANIGTISKFGFIATLFCFATMSLLVWGAKEAKLLYYYEKSGEKHYLTIEA